MRPLLLGLLAGLTLTQAAEARGWLPPVDLFHVEAYVGAPRVVLDANGNTTAIWEAWSGENMVIESAYRPAGEEWQPPTDISEASGEVTETQGEHSAAYPRLAIDASGDVTAVWERNATNGETILQTDYRPAGGIWQAPVDISAKAPTASTDEPWIASDAAGDFTAVWKQQGLIRSAQRPAGGEWQAPVDVSEEGAEALTPQAAVDAAGDATAVWMTEVAGRLVARTAYRPAGGSWGAPTPLSALGEEAGDPQIALDAHGDTMVVWQGAGRAVRGVYRPASGEWDAPSQISIPGEEAEPPRLAVDGAGDALVSWGGTKNELGGYEWAASAYRPADSGWEAPVLLSNEAGGNSFPQSVAFDQEGNAAIVWERSDTTGTVIQVDYRPAGEGWEASATLSDEGVGSFDPVVVLDAEGEGHAAQGDATVVWSQATRGDCGIGIKGECLPGEQAVRAAGYDQDESAGEEFTAPTEGTAGVPVSFSAPSLDAFSPVIDFGDGGSVALTSTTHTYSQPGEYTVKFASTELLGYRTSTMRKVMIAPAPRSTLGGGGPSSHPGEARETQPPSSLMSMAVSPPPQKAAVRPRVTLVKQSLRAILTARAIRIVCAARPGSALTIRGPRGLEPLTVGTTGHRPVEIALAHAQLRRLRHGRSARVRLTVTSANPGTQASSITLVFEVHG